MKKFIAPLGALALILTSTTTLAAGLSQTDTTSKYGMKVWGLYIQPVLMSGTTQNMKMSLGGQEHSMSMNEDTMKMTDHNVEAGADIHLEAKIHAEANNPYSFVEDSWIPYLTVDYRIEQTNSDWFTSGTLDPMVANDGPHYGGNVKLNGVGKYKVMFRITPPELMLHTDKETAPTQWFAPFIVNWDMTYLGTGKKGGY